MAVEERTFEDRTRDEDVRTAALGFRFKDLVTYVGCYQLEIGGE